MGFIAKRHKIFPLQRHADHTALRAGFEWSELSICRRGGTWSASQVSRLLQGIQAIG